MAKTTKTTKTKRANTVRKGFTALDPPPDLNNEDFMEAFEEINEGKALYWDTKEGLEDTLKATMEQGEVKVIYKVALQPIAIAKKGLTIEYL